MNDHRLPLSQRVVSIRTPENIELSYALAGPGSRAVAYLIDLLIMFVVGQMLINLIVVCFRLALQRPGREGRYVGRRRSWAWCSFGLYNGYFILSGMAFERPDAGQAHAAHPRDQARRIRTPFLRHLVAEPAARGRFPAAVLRGGADEPSPDPRQPATGRPGRRHAGRLPGARANRIAACRTSPPPRNRNRRFRPRSLRRSRTRRSRWPTSICAPEPNWPRGRVRKSRRNLWSSSAKPADWNRGPRKASRAFSHPSSGKSSKLLHGHPKLRRRLNSLLLDQSLRELLPVLGELSLGVDHSRAGPAVAVATQQGIVIRHRRRRPDWKMGIKLAEPAHDALAVGERRLSVLRLHDAQTRQRVCRARRRRKSESRKKRRQDTDELSKINMRAPLSPVASNHRAKASAMMMGTIDKNQVIQDQRPNRRFHMPDLAAAAQEELLAKGFGPAFVAIGSMTPHAHEHGRAFMPPARQRVFRQGLPIALLARPCLGQTGRRLSILSAPG